MQAYPGRGFSRKIKIKYKPQAYASILRKGTSKTNLFRIRNTLEYLRYFSYTFYGINLIHWSSNKTNSSMRKQSLAVT